MGERHGSGLAKRTYTKISQKEENKREKERERGREEEKDREKEGENGNGARGWQRMASKSNLPISKVFVDNLLASCSG